MILRNNRNNATWAAILLTSVAMFPAFAHAQEDKADAQGHPEWGPNEIVVTAQKRAQSINDVGLTIGALGTDTLERQGIKSLGDLAQSVPGLTYANSDYGTPVFTLRGVGYYDNSLQGYPTTSVYVDEIPLPFPAMANHTNLDLQRVEVLKGPQGTLFGQNSTGGAINFIAAKPTELLAAGLNASIGRFGQGEANGYVSGPLSESLRARLAVQYGYGSPWQKSVTRDDTVGRKNYLNGRLLVDWDAASDIKISLNLNGWHDRSDPLAGQFIAVFPQLFDFTTGSSVVGPRLATYPFAPADPRAADWDPKHRPRQDIWQYQGALRADWNVSDNIVLTAISSYVRYKSDQVLELDGVSVNVYDFDLTGAIKSFTQEVRLTGGSGTPFQWTVGGNYENSKVDQTTYQTYVDSTIAAIFPTRTGKAYGNSDKENYAFFANGEYGLTPEVTLKAGARYTRSRQTLQACTYDSGDGSSNATIEMIAALRGVALSRPRIVGDCNVFLQNGTLGEFNDVLTEDNVSWRVGVDYKPSRNLLLYANVARGYKAGSYPVIGALDYQSNLPVKQEALTDYEVGFKAQIFDRRVSLNGAVFYYDYRNKQLLTKKTDAIAGLISALANMPKSEIKGAELELTAAPVDGLQVSGAVTYLDAEIKRYIGVNAGGTIADFAGTAIPFTPKWQLAANVDYTVPVSGRVRPFAGASLTMRTSTTSIVGSAAGAIINPGYRSLVDLKDTYHVRGYTLLDLRAGIEADDGSWRLMVWGKNVTNAYYWNNVATSYEDVTRYAGTPATYGVTFSVKYGG